MSEIVTLNVEPRTELGTANARRLRRRDKVPANVYGMALPAISVQLERDAITPVLVAAAHVVDLNIDGAVARAMIREVQYDTFFTKVVHVDFQRIDPNSRIDVEVEIATKGHVAAGVVDQPIHKITLNCLSYQVPEKLYVRINALKIGDSVTVGALELPSGATFSLSADTVILKISAPHEVNLETSAVNAAEPEVIGRKKAVEEEA